MTIFGVILVFLVTALVLAFSIYIALDSTKYTHNKFLKWLFTGLLTIIDFIIIETCALCAFAMCDMAAHDK